MREALDAAGHEHVRIVASGGFDAGKIASSSAPARRSTPTASDRRSCSGANDFTADVVRLEGRDCAKAGRRFRPNPRLERVMLGLMSRPRMADWGSG